MQKKVWTAPMLDMLDVRLTMDGSTDSVQEGEIVFQSSSGSADVTAVKS